MSLAAFTVTDDTGDHVSGSIGDNAWVQLVKAWVDARWSRLTVTSTGSQNNLSITSGGLEADLLLCNNASDLTLTGIAAPASPAKPGKRLIVISIGAGHVYLAHQSGSSTAANRLANIFTAGATPLAAGSGVAVLVYDDNASRWRLVAHDQGAAIAYTPTWTASSVNPAIGNGTLSGRYIVRGRRYWVDIHLVAGSTTTFGTGTWSFALPFAAIDTNGQVLSAWLLDSGTTQNTAAAVLQTTTTICPFPNGSAGALTPTVPWTWAQNDQARITGECLST